MFVAPCIKCGSEDIAIGDQNYSSFNFGGGTCKKCGHDVSKPCSIFPSKEIMIKVWNNANHPHILMDKARDAQVAAQMSLAQKKRDYKAAAKIYLQFKKKYPDQ